MGLPLGHFASIERRCGQAFPIGSFCRSLQLAGLCAIGTCLLQPHPTLAEPINAAQIVTQDGDQYREVKDAIAKFKAGQYQEAEEALEVAVVRHPELSPAPVMLSRLFMTVNAMPAARGNLEKAVSLLPEDPEAYEMLGNLALSERRMTEAGLLFDKVLELYPKLPGESKRKKEMAIHAYAGKAAVSESRQKWDDASQLLGEWIKLDPQNYRPRIRLGQVHFYQKKPTEAYQEFQAGAKLSDQSPNAEIFMGRLYRQAGTDPENQEQAKHWMNLAIETSPTSPTMHTGVAEWLWESGKLDEAKKHADEALKLKPDSLDAKIIAGIIARFRKDYAEAEKQFEGAYLSSPSNFTASNQLALALADQGDDAKRRRALELAELNARQLPNNPEAAATLGWMYLQAGRLEEAARALQSVVSTGSVTGDAAYYVAQLFTQRKQDTEAKRFLRAAVDAKGPFVHREDAQQLLEQLNNKKPEATPAATAP